MNFHLSSSDHPLILILMVLLMHPELKMSTIRITTGLSINETRDGLMKLLDKDIIENISRSRRNPTFRLVDPESAKLFLEELAKHKMIQI